MLDDELFLAQLGGGMEDGGTEGTPNADPALLPSAPAQLQLNYQPNHIITSPSLLVWLLGGRWLATGTSDERASTAMSF